MQNQQNTGATRWRRFMAAVLVVAGFLVAELAGSYALGLVLALSAGEAVAVVVYALVEIAVFTLFMLVGVNFEFGSFAAYGVTLQKDMWKKLGIGLGLGILALALVTLPLYLFGAYGLGRGYGGFDVVVLGLLQYVAVAYMEELLCRGFIQHRLLGFGPIPALVITSLIFSALHLLNPDFSVLAFVNIFLAGAFMGAVMYAFGSLWAAVGVHITWNWMQGSVLGIPVSGLQSYGLFGTSLQSGNTILTGGYFGAEGSVLCTVVLAGATAGLLWYAHKNGRLARYAKVRQAKLAAQEEE